MSKDKNNSTDLILQELQRNKVKFILLTFCDIFGNIKELTIPIEQAQKLIESGVSVSTFALTSCTSITKDDSIIKPDISTIRYIPWNTEEIKTCWLIGQVYQDNMCACGNDPRHILMRQLKKLEDMGYGLRIGAELEFFILNLRPSNLTKHEDLQGYLDTDPDIVMHHNKLYIINALNDLGINIEKVHKESAMGQYEISLKCNDALMLADQLTVLKHALKILGKKFNLDITFMPKPFRDVSGNGLHFHFSLVDLKTGENIFFDKNSLFSLSYTGQKFISGVLKYIKETTALFNPTINSYKRFVNNFEATSYITWGVSNRSALIRIPCSNCKPNQVRGEVRSPDPMCNYYIALANLLAMGIAGIEQNLILPNPEQSNLFDTKILGIDYCKLPYDLIEALDLLEQSEFSQNLLGKELLGYFLDVKRKEIKDFNSTITEWEIKKYL